MKNIYQEHDNFEKWQTQWDAALEKGIFDTPKKDHVPSAQKNPESFFGTQKNSPSEEVPQTDSEFWRDIYRNSREYGTQCDLDGRDDSMIQESSVAAPLGPKTANPVRVNTLGMDQDVKNVGSTYDVADLQNLENLKVKLHGLLDKLNGLEGKGQGAGKLESQIQSLQKQIDEFSDNLSVE